MFLTMFLGRFKETQVEKKCQKCEVGKFNSFLLCHLFHFPMALIKIHMQSRCSQDALARFLRESDFDNQVQEYFKTGDRPTEMLLVQLLFI